MEQTDNVNPEVVTQEVDEVDTTQNPETGDTTEVQPEEFKPWKKQPRKPEENHIPYARFKEVNDERKTYAAKVEEYETQLAKYRERETQIEKIKDPDDLKIEDYETPQDYLKALTKATKEQALREFETQAQERAAAKKQQEYFESVTTNYNKKIQEASARNPEIKEAVDWFDQHAHNLNPDVAHELLIDENVGYLIHKISTNQELLTKVFRGNPHDVIRELHKMSAKIDRESYTSKPKAPDVPDALDVKAKLKGAIPTNLRGAVKTPSKDPSKMTMAEYRKWRMG